MSKLSEMCAFGEAPEQSSPDPNQVGVRVLRAAMRWVLAIALLGIAFSGVMVFREYVSPETIECAPLGPSGSALGLPPCVYGLALYAVLAAIAALALVRTRGGVGDELMITSL